MYIRTDVWTDKEFCALKSTCMYVWRDEKEEKKTEVREEIQGFFNQQRNGFHSLGDSAYSCASFVQGIP